LQPVPSLIAVNFKNANLSNTDLSNTNLDLAYLKGAILNQAIMEEANFHSSHYRPGDLTPKQISKCKNIDYIKGLTDAFLREVRKLNPKLMKWWQDPTNSKRKNEDYNKRK